MSEWLGEVPDVEDKWGNLAHRNERAAQSGDNAAEQPEQVQERPRDEQGRFVAVETETEQQEQEPEQEQEQEPGQEKILGKFTDADELARAYMGLETKLGEQGKELGQLRQAVIAQQQQPQPQQPQPRFDLNAVLEESPARAAELAYQSGDQQALEYVLNEWNDLSPGARDLWIENKQNQMRLQQMEARQASVEAPIRQQQANSVLDEAYQATLKMYPDFDTFRDEMASVAGELAQRNGTSFVDTLVATNNPTTISEGLEYLYLKAKGRKTDNLSNLSQELAQEHVENVNRAKREAIVASGTNSGGETATPSAAQRIKESWDKLSSPYAPGPDGWNV